MQQFEVKIRYVVVNTTNMKQKKAIIDTYETLYGVDIVVANRNTTLKDLQKLYVYSDGAVLDDYIIEAMAASAIVKRIKDNKTCVLIKDNKDSSTKGVDKKIDRINTIAHEALHAVFYIYENYMDQKLCGCSSEPACYLIGYIAECVYKTLTKK